MSDIRVSKDFLNIYSKMRDTGVDFQVFFLMIIFCKKNFIKDYLKYSGSSSFHDFVYTRLKSLSDPESKILKSFANQFESDLDRFSKKYLGYIQDTLEQDEYENTFDEFLFLLNEVMGKKGGAFIQPDEISELMIEIADLKGCEKIYNPFAGYASFGTKLENTNGYIGQEINDKTYEIALLRLIAHGKLSNSDFRKEDSILNWPSSQKFDLVIASLPFGLKIDRRSNYPTDSNTVEHFYLNRSIESINESGKTIALISNSILSRLGKEKQLREWLITNDLIETIISLPGNLLFNTSIPSSIIVLGKNKKNKGYVKMVDASEMVEVKLRGTNRLIVKEVKEAYHSYENSEFIRLVSASEVEKNDYNLTVSRYFVENIAKDIDGVRLREIISHVEGSKVNRGIKTKYLRINDLNDHNMGVYADLDTIKVEDLKETGYQVNKQVLLLANRLHHLNPTILETPESNLVISNEIRAFEVKSSKVDIGYLVFELRKEYVLEQVVKYQTGTGRTYISVDDLLNIKIKLPSKKEQRQQLLEEINRRAKNELNKYSKELSGMKVDMFKDFSSTRHSVKQYLNSIRGAVDGLKKYMKLRDGENIHLKDIYSRNLNITLHDHLQKLIDDTISASQLLDKLETPLIEGSMDKLDLIELTKVAMNKFRSSREFEYDFHVDKPSFLIDEQDEVNPIIEINKDDYFKLFQNIIDNACNHGFENDQNNIIRIEISSTDEGKCVLLEISNNGKPFDEKFSEERLKIRGEKSVSSKSTGIGGADIDQITKIYGGNFKLQKDSEKEFPVTYLIKFPIKIEGIA